MKVGDRLTKTWEVKHVVKGTAYKRDGHRKIKYNCIYALLKSDKGQERVLQIKEGKKQSINDCKRYYGWSSFKYSDWSQEGFSNIQ